MRSSPPRSTVRSSRCSTRARSRCSGEFTGLDASDARSLQATHTPFRVRDHTSGADATATDPGPTTGILSGVAASAQKLFCDAVEAYWKRTRRHLVIHIDDRDVFVRADLDIHRRLGNPGYNAADVPGISVHNYGFAIDVSHHGEAEVVQALDDAGWDCTALPKEPWHWVADDASEYAAAACKREAMRKDGSLARRWQATWEGANTKNKKRNKLIDDFRPREQAWTAERNRLVAWQDELSRRAAALDAAAAAWNAARDA